MIYTSVDGNFKHTSYQGDEIRVALPNLFADGLQIHFLIHLLHIVFPTASYAITKLKNYNNFVLACHSGPTGAIVPHPVIMCGLGDLIVSSVQAP